MAQNISIHALREEGDSSWLSVRWAALVFLSTPSARRATFSIVLDLVSDRFLSTPSARRATFAFQLAPIGGNISIHALREEGDRRSRPHEQLTEDFYPRPPRGGRPRCPYSGAPCRSISIHALREEGDASSTARSATLSHFYPRPPRGGRQTLKATRTVDRGFLSTPSARRATPRHS